MQYQPKKGRPTDLVDIDDLVDPDLPLPRQTVRQVPGPVDLLQAFGARLNHYFNLKTSRAGSNLALTAVMAGIGCLIFRLLAPLAEAAGPAPLAMASAAGGLGLGFTLLFIGIRRGDERIHGRTHLFFFISGAMGLAGWIPFPLLAFLLFPVLVGYGIGSFLCVLACSLFPGIRTAASREFA